MKCLTVVGARPQFIKAAAVSVQFRESGIEEVMIHTGQHYDPGMSRVFFEQLGLRPENYNLSLGGGSHGKMTGAMLSGVEEILEIERPDIVLVYGDTNSTLAGALAAVKLHMPIAHVEAGLRSFNRRMPEEINRVLVDHVSSLLFTPSDLAKNNLLKEGISTGINTVGDVMLDVQRLVLARILDGGRPSASLAGLPKRYYLATCHRAENTDNPMRLAAIFDALQALPVPVVMPLHPRTNEALRKFGIVLGNNVRVISPLGYVEMLEMLLGCEGVLTDSGGLQKEAYWVQKTCITLRDESEWHELVASGWNIIAGADPQRIVAAAAHFDQDRAWEELYGDGHAAELICSKISEFLR